ncbi:MAG: cytochrome c oxidase subunit II [Bacteroidetes bacterium]|nr:MAG: cytochrome c oxidase subunit II [Bacteroidota bacterium]
MSIKLITLIVIVLGVLALAQLVRVYELSSKLRNRREEDITHRDNKANATLMLLFMILSYVGYFYLIAKFGWTGRGEAASLEGVETDWLLNVNFIIINVAFFLTNTLLFYFSYKYVRKPGVKAYYYPHNNKLEMLWTVVPAIVLAVIIILGLKLWNNLTGDSAKDAIRIELFSKQFDWTARYAGENNKLGYFDYKLTTQQNELALKTSATLDSAIRLMEYGSADGTVMGIALLEKKLNDPANIFVPEDREKMEADLDRKTRLLRLLYQMRSTHDAKHDALAYDDIIQKDTLHLMVDQEYEFNFRSKDVIHSAYFPHFRQQINTVPGLTTRLKFTPTITTADMKDRMKNPDFNYVLMCNKICGGAHYKMKMIIVVDTPEDYKKWLAGKSTFGDDYLKKPEAPVEMAVPEAPVADTVQQVAVK